MKSSLPLLGYAALAAGAFAVGYIGGAKGRSNHSSKEPVGQTELAKQSSPDLAAETTRETLLRVTSHPTELQRTYEAVEWIRSLHAGQFADAAALANSLPVEQSKDLLRMLYSAWLRHDPRAAMDDAHERGDLPPVVPFDLLREWAERDVLAAVDWVSTSGNQSEQFARFYGLNEALLKLARDKPRTMHQLLSQPEIARAVRNIDEIVGVLAQNNSAEAMEMALALPSNQRPEAITAVLGAWGLKAPEQALAWVAAQPGDRPRLAEWRKAVLQAWAGNDLSSASQYVQAMDPGSDRDEAITEIATGMLKIDREGAAILSRDVPITALLSEKGFFSAWAEQDVPAAGLALAERLQKEGTLEDRAANNVAKTVFSHWIYRDAEGAAAFAIDQEATLRDMLLPSAVHSMSMRDRERTLEWAQGLPPGEARSIAYGSVVSEWVSSSINEVAAWLPSVPPGEDYNAAVGAFAGRAFATDPVSALEWVRTIPDLTARDRALMAAWKEWSYYRNSEQAEAWLKSTSDLTAAERAILESATKAWRSE
ncbi:MAG: hypothetical protein ACO1QR_01240 [Chthoniobacteraceae bacterium]